MPDDSNQASRQESFSHDKSKIEGQIMESKKIESKIKGGEAKKRQR